MPNKYITIDTKDPVWMNQNIKLKMKAKKNLCNKHNEKKLPLISPLLVDDKFVTDIKTKASIFNKIFAEQCSPL